MAIHLAHNPYQGINAHYNSLLLDWYGGWMTFHNDHVAYIKNLLNQALPPNYYAVSENSLQIVVPEEPRLPARPDIVVFAQDQTRTSTLPSQVFAPTLEIASAEFFPDEDGFAAVVIYRTPGTPVTRIELLSPSNKTEHVHQYQLMRHKTLASGINLVEIDYIHEAPSPFRRRLPDYTKQEPNSYPFYITIDDREKLRFYCFHVDEPIPTLPIPLLESESVVMDFGEAYCTSFSNDRRTQIYLDYEQLPANFERYSTEDQARIRAVMERVKAGNNT